MACGKLARSVLLGWHDAGLNPPPGRRASFPNLEVPVQVAVETSLGGKSLKEVLASDTLGLSDAGVKRVVGAVVDTSVELSGRLRRAALGRALGRAHRRNAFGDDVQKLDAQANTLFCAALTATRSCIAIASEELDVPIVHEGRRCSASVMLDPLDGSGNIDIGLSVGSIFAVHRDVRWPSHEHAFFRPGRELAAAGYVLYGARTTLVLASARRVMAFDLDETGEYLVTQPEVSCPAWGRQYSVNEANQGEWEPATRAWLEERRRVAPDGKRASLRYVGALVADAHRTLMQGGVFAYPGTASHPDGKLRLLYEVNPIAFLFEAAGGAASTGRGNPLDRVPTSLHQRSALVVGSKSDVDAYERARFEYAAKSSKIPGRG